MKTLIIILAISFTASAQSLRLQDHRIPQRTLTVNGSHYTFSDGVGGARFEGDGTVTKTSECRLRLVNTTPTHTIITDANFCNQTGTMTLLRFLPDGFIEYRIFDKTKE